MQPTAKAVGGLGERRRTREASGSSHTSAAARSASSTLLASLPTAFAVGCMLTARFAGSFTAPPYLQTQYGLAVRQHEDGHEYHEYEEYQEDDLPDAVGPLAGDLARARVDHDLVGRVLEAVGPEVDRQ